MSARTRGPAFRVAVVSLLVVVATALSALLGVAVVRVVDLLDLTVGGSRWPASVVLAVVALVGAVGPFRSTWARLVAFARARGAIGLRAELLGLAAVQLVVWIPVGTAVVDRPEVAPPPPPVAHPVLPVDAATPWVAIDAGLSDAVASDAGRRDADPDPGARPSSDPAPPARTSCADEAAAVLAERRRFAMEDLQIADLDDCSMADPGRLYGARVTSMRLDGQPAVWIAHRTLCDARSDFAIEVAPPGAFDSCGTVPLPAAAAFYARVADTLADYAFRSVVFRGHTDARDVGAAGCAYAHGRIGDNYLLAARRAWQVMRIFEAVHAGEESAPRWLPTGIGEATAGRRVSGLSAAAQRARDRRVVVELSDAPSLPVTLHCRAAP